MIRFARPSPSSAAVWPPAVRRWRSGASHALLATLLFGLLVSAGCSLEYSRGQSLETAGRWEEAMLAYRNAVINDPDDAEAREALERTRKVVARDNLERYRRYLADKAFRKAYERLVDAARQDPDLQPAQEELAKWDRVLVSGQLLLQFDAAQVNIALAEEITLTVRINTPNPGETLDAPVDLRTGTFYAEDLVYDRAPELLTLYTVNAVGVELVFGRTRVRQFTTREYQRFVNIRTPILDDLSGTLALRSGAEPRRVVGHRSTAERFVLPPGALRPVVPLPNPHYTVRIQGDRVVVDTAPTDNGVYLPRFLYMNKADRRVLVDFGRYEARLNGPGQAWTLRRLPLENQDYLARLSRNIALQPYFFYREGVFTYAPARSG